MRPHMMAHHAQAPTSPVSTLGIPHHLQEMHGPLGQQYHGGTSGFGSSPPGIVFHQQQQRLRQQQPHSSSSSVNGVMQMTEFDSYAQYGSADQTYSGSYHQPLGEQAYYHDPQQAQHELAGAQFDQGSYATMVPSQQGKLYHQHQPQFSQTVEGPYYGAPLETYPYPTETPVYQQQQQIPTQNIAPILESTGTKWAAKQPKTKANPPKKQKQEPPIQMVPTHTVPVSAPPAPSSAPQVSKANGISQSSSQTPSQFRPPPLGGFPPSVTSQSQKSALHMNGLVSRPPAEFTQTLDSHAQSYIPTELHSQ